MKTHKYFPNQTNLLTYVEKFLKIRKPGLFLIFFLQAFFVFAQYPLPANWQQRLQQEYNKLKEKDISFEEFSQNETAEYQRTQALQKGAASVYQPKPSKSICGNGDFETSVIDQSEWTGGYGSVDGSGNPEWVSMTAGFSGGNLTDINARQTIVTTGTDPNVGIPLVHGGNRALRIGNAWHLSGAELVSKTFTVTPDKSIISFWYAVVLQDPQHQNHERPSFWVRVLDDNGTQLNGLVNLGNPVQKDKIWADSSNPFFKVKTVGGQKINYTDWTCADINLQKEIGKTVTIQFITEDCTQGAHYGYAYIDDFCGTCTSSNTGWITFSQAASNCQQGKICFDYGLPNNGSMTGTIQITLEILQDGNMITTLNSPVLNSGSQFCFTFQPCRFPNLDPSKDGFDFVAVANPKLGITTLPQKFSGSKPNGHISGLNNDCECKTSGCCPGENLIRNGNFEAGNTGFTSQYAFNAATTAWATLPGQYNIVTGAQALAISSGWIAQDPGTCSNASGKFMAVNGATTGSGRRVIWEQTIPVKEWGRYKFCANVKNLKQCTFDVKPKVDIEFSLPFGNLSQTLNVSAGACGWYKFEKGLDNWGYGNSLNIKIFLHESPPGDGNDLALDDIALIEIPVCPVSAALFQITTIGLNATDYQVSATSTTTSQCDKVWWKVCEWDMGPNACAAGTEMGPLAIWGTANTAFPGYTFSYGKLYKITRGTWGECHAWNQFDRYVGSSLRTQKITSFTQEQYDNNRQAVLNSLK